MVSTSARDTPRSIRRLLRRCLRKDPQRRLHDIADARIEIDDRSQPLAAITSVPATPTPVEARYRRWERLAWIVAAVLGVALCAMAFFYMPPAPPAADPVEFVITPGENSRFPGPSPQFAISPDGRHVAFVAITQGVRMLWVRSLATLASRSLPGTEGARNPFWSSDSRSIGFFAPTRLKRVQANGGRRSSFATCDL